MCIYLLKVLQTCYELAVIFTIRITLFHVPSCFSILRKIIQILQRTFNIYMQVDLHEILIFTSYIDGSVFETLGNFSLPGLNVLVQRSKVMIVIEIYCVLDKNCLLFDIFVGVFFQNCKILNIILVILFLAGFFFSSK